MPKVYNLKNKNVPPDAIYIGRPSSFGNPFVIGKDGSRKEVIHKFEEYLLNNLELLQKVRTELVGKDLVCFCSPAACHGDVLLKYANGAATLDI